MVTNFLKLCSQGSANGVAFGDGVSGVDCATREGSMCTGKGLFLGLAVALGSKFLGID